MKSGKVYISWLNVSFCTRVK